MSNLARPFSSALGHAQRSLLRSQAVGEWCICRFVKGNATDREAPATHGWPLHSLSNGIMGLSYGWHRTDPIAFFSEGEARDLVRTLRPSPIADGPSVISYDRAVHVSKIRWKVRLYSHYDSSEAVHETASYAEALLAFGQAMAVCARENTPKVAYLQASLDGTTSVPSPNELEVAQSSLPLLGGAP